MDTTTKPVQGTQTNTEETETPALAAEEACPAGEKSLWRPWAAQRF